MKSIFPAMNDTDTQTETTAQLSRTVAHGASPDVLPPELPEVDILEAAAAQNAEIAAEFARSGNRRAARDHLHRAIAQLNEAEIED